MYFFSTSRMGAKAMCNDLLVSVIVPVYNCEEYLASCIESIIHYKYDDLELIIIDDGSTDNSKNIICDYMKKDKRIKLICQDNSGPGAARNTGLIHAQGEYILFVDADDWIEKDAIVNCRGILLSKEFDTVILNYKTVDLNLNTRANTAIFDDGFIYNCENKVELYDVIIACRKINNIWGQFYSNRIIKKYDISFNETMKYAEDVVFNMGYFYYSKKGLYKNFHYYNYRYNPISLTKRFNSSKFNDFEKLYNYTVEYIDKYGLNEQQKKRAYNKILRTLLNLVSQALLNDFSIDKLKDILNKHAFKKIINGSETTSYKQRVKKTIIRFNFLRLYKYITVINYKIKKTIPHLQLINN